MIKTKFSDRSVDRIKVGDVWRHLRREVDYEILNVHKDPDDSAIVYVIYRAIHSSNIYARRVEYFLSYEEISGNLKYKFVKVK